jgi:uncharacterized protein (TIGR04255 family)
MAVYPDYRNPPVIEVVLGTQFAPLVGFSAALLGVYWGTIRGTFERTQEHPPVAHMVELDELREGPSQLEVGVLLRPPLPRTWFVTSDETQIIQLQGDWFLRNWRKVHAEQVYPRFPSIKEAFLSQWSQFKSFLEQQGLPAPQVDQCEVTYVNIIRKGEGWESLADVGDLFTTLRWSTRFGFLPEPESLRWGAKFRLPENLGRMHVDIVPAFEAPTNNLVLRFTLTARGVPGDAADEKSLDAWYGVAHEWIVKGFADLVGGTTDRLWGKVQ